MIPIWSSFLQELVIVISVRIGAIFVNNLFKVGKSLSVKFRNCLVPKPIWIIWNVGQCAISAELKHMAGQLWCRLSMARASGGVNNGHNAGHVPRASQIGLTCQTRGNLG